jgi:hypothetical protein
MEGQEQFYVWQQTYDISETETEDIVALLPQPIKSRKDGMMFPVIFKGLLVCLAADQFLK